MRKIAPSDRTLLESADHASFECASVVPTHGYMPIEVEERMREWAKLGWIAIVHCAQGHEHAQLTPAGREAIRLQDIADGKIPA